MRNGTTYTRRGFLQAVGSAGAGAALTGSEAGAALVRSSRAPVTI